MDIYGIKFSNNFILPIFNNCDCFSNNLVYVIYCNFCNSFYIGQTGNCIKERLYNHLYKIKTWSLFSNDNTCVSNHFNLKLHNYKFHFKFFILRTNLDEKFERLNFESFFVNLFLHYNIKIINDFIPDLKNYISN